MGKITDEFEIVDDISLNEIRNRVNLWFESPPGDNFAVSDQTDDHVSLKRKKYRPSICTIPIWTYLTGQIYLASMASMSIDAILTFILVLGITTVCAVIGFFLLPRRSTYSMKFEHGTPTRVLVNADVKFVSSIPEYYSLKVKLRNPSQDQGPVIGT